MCGIAAILDANLSRESQKKLINEMTSSLGHRGPDGWGTYQSEQLALGHSRLSIIDLSSGDQPMMTERFVISYNGEIFNYIELREELVAQSDVHFRTTSDTEVILRAFEVYGTEAIEKFNGQFAFLIWDRREKELLIARDRYGIRPLYILEKNGDFYFSSEMKAFDALPHFSREYDIEHLYEHSLLWNTLDDATVYKDIRSLPAGTYEVYKPGSPPQQTRYYQLGETTREVSLSIDEAAEEFSGLLAESVQLRLRSDVPVATYLSGGIDSSVTSYLTSLYNKERFKTFSVSFSDKEYDETFYQKEMVNRLKSDHSNITVNYTMINDNFFDAVYHFERPVFRTAPLPLFLLSKLVKNEGIKVVLTGEGADEILFGYDSYKEIKLLDFWARQPDSTSRPQLLKRLYPHLQHYKDPKRFGLMKMYYEGFLESYKDELVGLNIRVHNNKGITNYFNKDLSVSFNKDKLIDKLRSILPANFNDWTLLQKNQYLELKTLLPGYLLSAQGDRMSMAHGIEGRYPFLDHRLIETLFHYPDRFKLKVFQQKYLLAKAYSDTIPSSIIKRPKRPYMAPDLKSFFENGKLTEQAEYFLSPKKLNDYGVFDEKIVTRLVKKFSRNMPQEIGYRDNMVFTFVLSSQMAAHWAQNPKKCLLELSEKTVNIEDFT